MSAPRANRPTASATRRASSASLLDTVLGIRDAPPSAPGDVGWFTGYILALVLTGGIRQYHGGQAVCPSPFRLDRPTSAALDMLSALRWVCRWAPRLRAWRSIIALRGGRR